VTRALESISDFRDGNFLAWLAAITRSRVANHLRRNPARAVGGSDAQRLLAELADPHDPEETTGAGEPVAEADLGGVLRRAVEQVRARASASSWQAFWQVAVEGRKPADVAADLGLTTNAVYIATSRILSRLRAALGEFPQGHQP
jgi:RNA polymerase sigma-70 factor (ECF subfamily)